MIRGIIAKLSPWKPQLPITEADQKQNNVDKSLNSGSPPPFASRFGDDKVHSS